MIGRHGMTSTMHTSSNHTEYLQSLPKLNCKLYNTYIWFASVYSFHCTRRVNETIGLGTQLKFQYQILAQLSRQVLDYLACNIFRACRGESRKQIHAFHHVLADAESHSLSQHRIKKGDSSLRRSNPQQTSPL